MLWSKTGLKYQKFLPKQPKSFQRKDIYNQSSKIVSSKHCGFHFEMNFLSWDLKASWPAWPCKEFVVEKTFATNSLNVQANLQSAKPLLALKLKQNHIQKIDQHWVENVNKKTKAKVDCWYHGKLFCFLLPVISSIQFFSTIRFALRQHSLSHLPLRVNTETASVIGNEYFRSIF